MPDANRMSGMGSAGAGPSRRPPAGMVPGQQSHQQMGMMPPQSQSYKGTLPPGTRVAVGNMTVTVKRYLSEGGFAHVYLVTSDQPIPIPVSAAGGIGASSNLSQKRTRPETLHVLKRMAVPDKDALAHVRSEVEAHKLLRNQPNIVHFIEASATSLPTGGYEIFILMEYCAGGGIIDLMNARLRDRLREHEVLKIFGDVCAGVAVMHHLDPPLMHRDLKVENILLSPPPADNPSVGPTYKLCDFGSAAPVLSRRPPKSLDEIKRVEADLNRSTTLQYRAPEMVDVYQRRVIDEKADIWALGVFLYKLCYYTTPFEENGGGPLAILSANYRIPPQPVYSQKLKDLIRSLLREQSSDRPTIDQVVVHVHQILGAKAPASALHYAQQAAEGKQFQALPTVVSSTSASQSGARATGGRPSLDDTAIIEAAKLAKKPVSPAALSPRTMGMDLIQVSETEEERRRAEVAALKQGVTPMRRGRPVRTTSSTPAPPAAASSPGVKVPTSTLPSSNPPTIMKQLTGEKVKSPSSSSGITSPSSAVSATVGRNFGSRFAEGRAAFTAAASSANGVKGSSGFDDSFSPTLEVPKKISSGLMSRFGGSNEGGASSPSSARQSPALLDHSPDLPGFSSPSLTPNNASSPALTGRASVQPTASSAASSLQAITKSSDDDASSRFPSVEELDARYAIKPQPSISGSSRDAASASLARRSFVPPSKASAPSPHAAAAAAAIGNRESVSALASKMNGSGRVRDSLPASLSSSVSPLSERWSPAGTKKPPFTPSSAKPTTTSTTSKPDLLDSRQGSLDPLPPAVAKAPAPRDWLTGDDTEEAIVPASSSSRGAPTNKEAPAEESDDDEDEGPEDLSQSAATKYGSQAAPQAKPPVGKVKAPSWMEEGPKLPPRKNSEAAVASPEPLPSSQVSKTDLAEPSAISPQSDEILDEDDVHLAIIEGKIPGARRKITAPAWDEMDEPEMRALSQQPMQSTPAASSSPPKETTAAFRKGRLSTLISQAEQRDQKASTEQQPPVASGKQYADASTSPIQDDPGAPAKLLAPSKTSASVGIPVSSPTSAPSITERMQDLKVATSGRTDATVTSPSAPSGSVRDRYKPIPTTATTSPADARPAPAPVKKLAAEPQVILPRKTTTAPVSSAGRSGAPPPPPAGLKPWEREAAAAAEVQRSGIVRSATLAAHLGSNGDKTEEEDAAAGGDEGDATEAGRDGKDGGRARQPGEAQERFKGVSELISRWQANAASNAPGWGRVGESTPAWKKGPNFGAEAAAAVNATAGREGGVV